GARRDGASNVRILPPTPQIERYYAAADIFLLPSYYDACSLSVLEALAAGLPVITTSRNGASEALQGGRSGFTIRHARDLEAHQGALAALLDPDRRAAMGAAARRSAESLTSAANFRRVAGVLDGACAARRLIHQA